MVEPSRDGKSVITGLRSGGLLCPLSRPTAPPAGWPRSARARRTRPPRLFRWESARERQRSWEYAGKALCGAKEWAAPRVQIAVLGAREWAAPRLEDAADAVTTSVAPKVSSALRSTARQVRPDAGPRPRPACAAVRPALAARHGRGCWPPPARRRPSRCGAATPAPPPTPRTPPNRMPRSSGGRGPSGRRPRGRGLRGQRTGEHAREVTARRAGAASGRLARPDAAPVRA